MQIRKRGTKRYKVLEVSIRLLCVHLMLRPLLTFVLICVKTPIGYFDYVSRFLCIVGFWQILNSYIDILLRETIEFLSSRLR